VGAYLIDVILLAIVGSIIGGILGFGAAVTVAPGELPNDVLMAQLASGNNLLGLVLGIAYFAGMESSSFQATLGKKALGMVVTDLAGNRISFLRGVGRYFAKILSTIILFIGFIMVAFTGKKQGLHDMLAGTLVYVGNPVQRDVSVFN
ncbi:MAG TPA: RDD family protein, partial [Paracoccaceae bacterium]|nr:RDD family protein [Paracoccaceae bacterium]